ncbi:MAG TPA: hypothetical protein VFR10_14390, partial [bacterium]|nr:hypothetical protein [bacterium]
MNESRDQRLAQNLVRHSMRVAPEDKVLLDFRGQATIDLLREVITEVTRAGGVPFVLFGEDSLTRRFLRDAGEDQVASWGKIHENLMREMQCYMRVNGTDNPFDLADLSEDARKWEREYYMNRV